eukprot:TRINITY_DN78025_c0_g1_i1.p1 TRINITY_DN78025_c0_g1~~TRINITY_DN78025_c0_g1_i1.p1  ORF type:complete len:754 (+),score=164.83 TRINITY_DN78025_c0_g1_i1:46-2262(+)
MPEERMNVFGQNVPDDFDPAEHRRKQAELVAAMQAKKRGTSQKIEDVTNLATSLRVEHHASREEMLKLMAELNGRLTEKVEQLSSSVEEMKMSTSKDRTDFANLIERTNVELAERSETQISELKGELRGLVRDGVAEMAKELTDKLQSHSESLEEVFGKVDLTRREVTANVAVMRAERKVLLDRHAKEVTDRIDEVEKAVEERCMEALRDTASQIRQVQAQDRHDFEDGLDKANNFANDLDNRLIMLKELADRNSRRIQEALETVKANFTDALVSMRVEHDKHLKELDDHCEALDNHVAEVENIPTRRVDWHIRDAGLQLSNMAMRGDLASGSPMWVSPAFEAAGAHGLQLELRFLQPAEVQANQEQDSVGSRGDCVLTLTAPEGLFLVCRLYVGTAFAQLEHTFDDEKRCCTKPLCYVRDQLGADNSLQISVEFLEAIRTVTKAIRPESLEQEDTMNRFHLGGDLASHRYLNHRTIDIMQNQVDLIRSSMVRRIEWRIEKASQMRRFFPENECICSTTFEAAGVDDLQLVFYPSGFMGAREGFCSFFLYCPAGVMLKCWLSVGKNRREARFAFEKPGYFGRTNFCRFDSCIDPDDTVLLVLDIDEAQKNVTEPLSHMSKVTVSTKHDEGAVNAMNEPDVPVPEKMDSSLRLQRLPGNKTLRETRQLPSIWTSVPKADVAEVLDGYHSFKDLSMPPRRPVTTGTQRPAPKGGVAWKDPHPPPPLSARQQNKYMMYASP